MFNADSFTSDSDEQKQAASNMQKSKAISGAGSVLSGIGKSMSSERAKAPIQPQSHPLPDIPEAKAPSPVQSALAAPVQLKSFKNGGLVPGKGPQKIIAHGGELIIPKHKVDKMAHDVLSGIRKPSGKTRVIHIKAKNRGKLHEKLGVKKGQKISLAKEEKAAHSGSPAERKEAQFAINARSWNKK